MGLIFNDNLLSNEILATKLSGHELSDECHLDSAAHIVLHISEAQYGILL
jgi:hypothetical protein